MLSSRQRADELIRDSGFETKVAKNTLRTILDPEEYDGEDIAMSLGGEVSIARIKTVRDIVVDPNVPDAHFSVAVFPSMRGAIATQEEIVIGGPLTDYSWEAGSDPHTSQPGELTPSRRQIAGYVQYNPVSQLPASDGFETFVPMVAPLIRDGAAIPGSKSLDVSTAQALIGSGAMRAGQHLLIDVTSATVILHSTATTSNPVRLTGVWSNGTTIVRSATTNVAANGTWSIPAVIGNTYIVGFTIGGNVAGGHYVSYVQFNGTAGDGGGGVNDFTGWNVSPAGIAGQFQELSGVITDYFIFSTSLRLTWTGSALAAGSLTGARVYSTEHPAYGDRTLFLRENSLSRMSQSRNDNARKGLFAVMFPSDPASYNFRPWDSPGAYDEPGAAPYLAATIVPSSVAGEPLTIRLVTTHIVVYRTPSQFIPKHQAYVEVEVLSAVFRYLALHDLIWENPNHLRAIADIVKKFGGWVIDHYPTISPVVRSVASLLPPGARAGAAIVDGAINAVAAGRKARSQQRAASFRSAPVPPAKPQSMKARPIPRPKPKRLTMG